VLDNICAIEYAGFVMPHEEGRITNPSCSKSQYGAIE
jgi:hypothetical protein